MDNATITNLLLIKIHDQLLWMNKLLIRSAGLPENTVTKRGIHEEKIQQEINKIKDIIEGGILNDRK